MNRMFLYRQEEGDKGVEVTRAREGIVAEPETCPLDPCPYAASGNLGGCAFWCMDGADGCAWDEACGDEQPRDFYDRKIMEAAR